MLVCGTSAPGSIPGESTKSDQNKNSCLNLWYPYLKLRTNKMFQGLSTDEVKERQKAHGPNALPTPKHQFILRVLEQFKDFFNLLLFAAAAVTLYLGEVIDAIFILFFVVIGVSLHLYQEFKTNAAAAALKNYLVNTITVIRNGKEEEVSTEAIVPGDILFLESGDIVPADAMVRYTKGLTVDETTFTGESIPVVKISLVENEGIAEENTLYQGVSVVGGTAFAEVIKTGSATRLAKIAKVASAPASGSELNKGVVKISGFIMKATVLTLTFTIIAHLFLKDANGVDLPHLLVFAVALAIAVIPQALPLVITFSLAKGSLALAKKKVVVKRLSSVQDLGSINLLCTDKTGTITLNQLVYRSEYFVPEAPFHPLLLARLAANDLNERIPEPFDVAIDKALAPALRDEFLQYQLLEKEAFDPRLRSNGAVVKNNDNNAVLRVRRGSPEYFLDRVVERALVENWLLAEEKEGRRVLGVSYDQGNGEKFGGFVSFVDALKPTTKQVVEEAREMNLKITIITGDSVLVSEAVGREAGLVFDSSEVVDTTQFLALPLNEQHDLIDKIRVFARAVPEQKHELMELLQDKYTVGFLGEGINDVLALKAANVSIVVKSASDIAREAADIILLKSDLRVIVEGIKMGRETFVNTLKYIRITLVSNFGNFYAVAISSLFITFLPLLPTQILLLNLLSDFPMLAIAFDRVEKEEIKHPQTFDFKALFVLFITLGLVSTFFDFLWFFLFYQDAPAVLQTNWFIASVLTEIVLLFSLRSLLPVGRAGWPARPIVVLSVLMIILTIALPIIPSTTAFFNFTTPSPAHLLLIISLTLVYSVTTELAKVSLVKFLKR